MTRSHGPPRHFSVISGAGEFRRERCAVTRDSADSSRVVEHAQPVLQKGRLGRNEVVLESEQDQVGIGLQVKRLHDAILMEHHRLLTDL